MRAPVVQPPTAGPLRSHAAAIALLVGIVAFPACGKKGPPVAPEPRGPEAPRQLTVRQIGDEIVAYFELPAARGTRPQQQPVRAELLRVGYPPGFVPAPDPATFERRGTAVAEADLSGPSAAAPVTIHDPSAADLEGDGGWTLRYAVRIVDQRGRFSRPVAAQDIQPLPPGQPPRNLTAEPSADGIRLKWDEPLSPRAPLPDREPLAGDTPTAGDEIDADRPAEAEARPQYNIYRAESGEAFPERPLTPSPLPERDYLDGRIVIGKTYSYVVRSLLASGRPLRESASSEVVEVEAWDRFAPEPPIGLVAVQEGPAVRLFWNPNREPDLAGYLVYRRVEDGEWQRIGPDPVESPTLIDRDVQTGQTVAYRVTAVDRADERNESGPTEERELVLAAEPSVPEHRP